MTRRKCNSLLVLIVCVVIFFLAFGIGKLFPAKTLGTNICSTMMVIAVLTAFCSLVVMTTKPDTEEQKKVAEAKIAK